MLRGRAMMQEHVGVAPRRRGVLSPALAFTSTTPSKLSSKVTSKVPPPRSKTSSVFSIVGVVD